MILSRHAVSGWGLTLASLLMTSQALAEAPSPERQAQLEHLLVQDCGSCHGLRMTGGLGPAITRDAAFTLREYDSVSRPGRLVPDVSAGGRHRIAGELFEVDDALLAELDAFERVGVDYERKTITLETGQLAGMYMHSPLSLRLARPTPTLARVNGDLVSWSESSTA